MASSTKNVCGCPIAESPKEPLLKQKHWRIAGGLFVGGAAFMAWVGVDYLTVWSLPFQLAYWGVFLVLLILAMYMVTIDIRYIRLQYKLSQREIFQNTLADEEFRKALRAAQEAEERDASTRDT